MSGVYDYQVPLISSDLRKEETIVQIIGSLNQLTNVSNNIFSKIEQKCEEFQSQLEGISKVTIEIIIIPNDCQFLH